MHEAWAELERDAFAVERRGVDVAAGLAGAVATAGPLLAGVVLDRPAAGLAAAIGALNVALGVPPRGARADRARWGGAALVGVTAGVALGTALHDQVIALVVVTMAVTAATAELRRFGRPGAMVGFVSAATMVIAGGLPDAGTPGRTVAALAGGALGLVLSLAVPSADTPVTASPIDAARLHAHAARTSLAVGVALSVARAAGVPFGAWVPLTTLAVLQPEPHASWVRMVQRGAGTLLGVLAVTAVTALTTDAVVLVPLVALTSGTLFALRDRSYYWLVLTLTPTALLMVSTDVPIGPGIGRDRLVATALGLAIAATANLATVAWIRRRGAGPGGAAPDPTPT